MVDGVLSGEKFAVQGRGRWRQLGEAAVLLRLEVALARSQIAAAASLARAFLKAPPNRPHADCVRPALRCAVNAGAATLPNSEEQR